MFDVNIEGVKATGYRLELAEKKITHEGYKGLNKVLLKMLSEAKEIVPVDTGRLSDSLKVEAKMKINSIEGRISANTEYAAAVETMKDRHPSAEAHAQGRQIPYLWPSVEKFLPEAKNIIAREIKT